MNKIVHIIIDHPELKDEFLKLCALITGAQDNVIFAADLKEGCEQATDYDYALISYVGTMYKLPYYPASNIMTLVDKWATEESQTHPCKQGVECLSPMFLDLNYYRSHGLPPYNNSVGFSSLERNFIRISHLASSHDHVLEFKRSKGENIIPMHPRVLYSELAQCLNQYQGPKPDVIYTVATAGVGEYIWSVLGHTDTKLVFLDPNEHVRLWRLTLYGYFGQKVSTVLDLERATNMISRRYKMLVDRVEYKPRTELEEDKSIWSNDQWVKAVNDINNFAVDSSDVVMGELQVDPSVNNLVYVEDSFIWPHNFYKTRTVHSMCSNYDYLCNLSNTTVIGISPHTKKISINENYSS